MSFSASAKRAADQSQPIGLRVACLHECLEQFNLFGFQATRSRLRVMQDVGRDGWTDVQLVSAVRLLTDARKSWSSFSRAAATRQQQLKRKGPRPPPQNRNAVFVAWVEQFLLRDDNAATWLVASLGVCDQCAHPLVHHRTHGCVACGANPELDWGDRCRVRLPGPPTTFQD